MKKITLWALAILLLASLACNLPFSTDSAPDQAEGLPDAAADSFTVNVSDASLLEPVEPSAAQRQVLATKGTPNRFMLLFSDGVREETWYYDALGYEVVFRNGEVYTESDVAAVDAAGFVSVYYPWQFNGQMGLSELLTVSGSESFGVESLEEVFEEDVSLVYLKGLDAGFREDRLLYIRAVPVGEGARDLPITAEGVEAAGQAGASVELTSAEQVHAGTHTYQMFCMYSDGTSEEESDQVTWAFTDEGVYFDGDGPYPQVAEDYYGIRDEAGELFIYFKENVVTITGEFIQVDGSGNEVYVTLTCALTQE